MWECQPMVEKFELSLLGSTYITPNVLHLIFIRKDGKKFDFVPGQFITLLLQDETGQVKRRSYSIANDPYVSDFIELSISYIQGGVASELLFNLKPGDSVSAMGPVGRLVIKKEKVKRYILVGTGTGVAPYRAMISELKIRLATQGDFKVVVLQGVQYRHDILYREDFERFADQNPRVEFIACLSREESELRSHEYKGYVQEYFEKLNLKPGQDVIYLCGNPKMIDEAFALLCAQGFSTTDLRREKYISSN